VLLLLNWTVFDLLFPEIVLTVHNSDTTSTTTKNKQQQQKFFFHPRVRNNVLFTAKTKKDRGVGRQLIKQS